MGAFTDSSQDLLAGVPDHYGSLAVMDNMHEPPSGDPQESWPTQEIGPSAGQAGPGGWGQPSAQPGHGQPGHGPIQGWGQGPRLVGPEEGWGQPSQSRGSGGLGGPAGPGGPGGPPPRPVKQRRHGTAAWWGAGVALVVLLAGGGAAAAQLTSSSAPAPTALTGQAAQLNTLLNSSSSSGSGAALSSTAASSTTTHPCLNRAKKLKAAGYPLAAQAVLRRCGHALRRLRLLGGMHGEFTFETKTGPRTIAFERGVIDSVSGSNVVVQAKDGTTWTWVLESSTVIRQGGQKSATSALSDGEHVFAGGSVISGGYDAKLIVVKPASGSSSTTPTPTPATGS
jgi:hypothetical protein